MTSFLLSSTCFCRKLTIGCPYLLQFLLRLLLKKPKIMFRQLNVGVFKLIHRLHVAGGHVSKTSLRLLLQRRGCPVWMQHMVGVIRVSNPVTLRTHSESHWEKALKVDIFELEGSHRKGFCAPCMDAACKLSSCSWFLEGNPRQRFEPNGATLISHLSSDWMHSDSGGCFVNNELREWAIVRWIGLLTAPGEFHGLTADLENLIRVIKRLVRKLADGHPVFPWSVLPTTTASRLEDTRQPNGLLGQTMRGTVTQPRCPLRWRLSGYPR